MLRHAGVFTVPLPDGWEVAAEPGPTYVLTPPPTGRGRTGEIRLAVFGRPPGPLAEREGADRLLELLGELGVDPDGEDVELTARYARTAHRALAWFPARDPRDRDVDCLAAVVVLERAVVAVTAMASPRRPDIVSAAELVVASLADEPPT
jgi:hypothetical protein